MSRVASLLVATCVATVLSVHAQDSPPKQQDFAPTAGKGRVVIVVSGNTGMPNYTATAQQFADAGFYVVLLDGNDFWIKDHRKSVAMLAGVIERAQADAHALPGKVGVVGYSLGGGTALVYAARMPGHVAVVIGGYPLTSFIKDPADFIAKTKVPIHIFAGTADTYQNCCLIETVRQLAAVAKAGSPPMLTLVEYEGVGHGFNLPNAPRKDVPASQDAMKKSIAQLREALPAEGAR